MIPAATNLRIRGLPDIGRFDEDPNKSYTMPGIYYYDPDVYRQELKDIFANSWQYVCHVSCLT